MALLKLIGPIVIGGIVGVAEVAVLQKCNTGWVIAATACAAYVVGYLDKDLTNYINSSGN